MVSLSVIVFLTPNNPIIQADNLDISELFVHLQPKYSCMRFNIVQIEELSGAKGNVFSIEGEDGIVMIDQFFEEQKNHENAKKIVEKIRSMSRITGFQDQYFKDKEGSPGDGIGVLKSGNLRLYCMRFNNAVVIFGSGGEKNVRAWQDDEILSQRVQTLKKISKAITDAILNKDLILNDDDTFECDDDFELEI